MQSCQAVAPRRIDAVHGADEKEVAWTSHPALVASQPHLPLILDVNHTHIGLTIIALCVLRKWCYKQGQ